MRRRDFIRTVIIGGAAAALPGFPYRRVYADEFHTRKAARLDWRRVRFETAHQLRDGHAFKIPPFSEERDIVIVGAGATSLTAGYYLRDADALILEKEPHTGGTGHREEWNGIAYTTGTAYAGEPSTPVGRFFEEELGLKLRPIASHDAYLMGGKVIWKLFPDGIDQLPLSKDSRQAFRRAYRRLQAVGAELWEEVMPSFRSGELLAGGALFNQMDDQSLMAWFRQQGFSEEMIDFASLYCPPQAGGYPEDLSSAFGCLAMGGWMGSYENAYTFPGGLGAANEVMRDRILASGADRIRLNAFAVRVANTGDGDRVDVTYLDEEGNPRTVRCRVCLWGAPKNIARYAVPEMPEAQREAISQLVTHNLSVMNLCYRETVFDGAYQAWIPDLPIVNLLPADWVLSYGKGNVKRPQVLSCDWPVRPDDCEHLLDDSWVVARCQETAKGMDRLFPGSLSKLEEIRVYVRAHSWVVPSPGYATRLQPNLSLPIGNILIGRSDQFYYDLAYRSGLQLAEKARQHLAT